MVTAVIRENAPQGQGLSGRATDAPRSFGWSLESLHRDADPT